MGLAAPAGGYAGEGFIEQYEYRTNDEKNCDDHDSRDENWAESEFGDVDEWVRVETADRSMDEGVHDVGSGPDRSPAVPPPR